MVGVASIRCAFEVATGREAHAGERHDALGPVRAGEIGIGLDPC